MVCVAAMRLRAESHLLVGWFAWRAAMGGRAYLNPPFVEAAKGP